MLPLQSRKEQKIVRAAAIVYTEMIPIVCARSLGMYSWDWKVYHVSGHRDRDIGKVIPIEICEFHDIIY